MTTITVSRSVSANDNDFNNNSSNNNNNKNSVTFENVVTVREYPLVLGNNPSCSSGAPITIGWEVKSVKTYLLNNNNDDDDDDNDDQQKQNKSRSCPIIPEDVRGRLLIRAGYTLPQISKATKEVKLVQSQRIESMTETEQKRFNLRGKYPMSFMSFLQSGKLPKGVLSNKDISNGSATTTTSQPQIIRQERNLNSIRKSFQAFRRGSWEKLRRNSLDVSRSKSSSAVTA